MSFKNILVPVDFSEHSLAALETAGTLAQQVGGSLILLYVLPPMVVMQGEMGPLVIPPDPDRREAIEKELNAVKSKVPAGVPIEVVIHEGHPWPGICDTAHDRQADLIVLASHGYTGLKRMLLGSTAEQVVRHAHCPVMVVKSFAGHPA